MPPLSLQYILRHRDRETKENLTAEAQREKEDLTAKSPRTPSLNQRRFLKKYSEKTERQISLDGRGKMIA